MIYFVGNEKKLKIGMTNNNLPVKTWKRVNNIMDQNSDVIYPFAFLSVIPVSATKEIEKYYHKRYNQYFSKNEWFEVDFHEISISIFKEIEQLQKKYNCDISFSSFGYWIEFIGHVMAKINISDKTKEYYNIIQRNHTEQISLLLL